jgi:hypothetical protein
MLDGLVLAEPCPVISNVHDSSSREPVGQHGLISKPVDLAVEPWLAGSSTKPSNGYNARRAISSYILYVGLICACYARYLLDALC